MGWQIIPGNDIASFYRSRSCRYIGVGVAVYRSWSCQYIGVGVARISESELPVYWGRTCHISASELPYIGVGAASILESELPVYRSQSCQYIGVGAASILESWYPRASQYAKSRYTRYRVSKISDKLDTFTVHRFWMVGADSDVKWRDHQSSLAGCITHYLLGDAPRPPMFHPIFLCHLCIFLLIVASPRRSALAAPILESDDHVT